MRNSLTWISARNLIGEFILWAENEKKEGFSYPIFRRAKLWPIDRLTDRHKLLIEVADEFVAIEEAKRIALPSANAG